MPVQRLLGLLPGTLSNSPIRASRLFHPMPVICPLSRVSHRPGVQKETVWQAPPLMGMKAGSCYLLARVLGSDLFMSPLCPQLRRQEVCLVMVELLPNTILEENSIDAF